MSLRRSLQLALAVVIVVAAASFGTAAGAVDDPSYTGPPTTLVDPTQTAEIKTVGVGTSAGSGSAAAAIGSNTAGGAVASRQRLAITGGNSGQLALYGALLLIGGATLLVFRRSDHA